MSDIQASARRIRAAYRGEKADRIPIASPINWHPMRDIDQERPGGWRAEAGFIDLARLVQQHCDPTPAWNAVPTPPFRHDFCKKMFASRPRGAPCGTPLSRALCAGYIIPSVPRMTPRLTFRC